MIRGFVIKLEVGRIQGRGWMGLMSDVGVTLFEAKWGNIECGFSC